MADRKANLSWSEKVSYACTCGVHYSVLRQRWVDAEEDPGLRERMTNEGPIEGTCPNCGESANPRGVWLELYPRRRKATLVLGPHHRAELGDEIRAHVRRVAERLESWEAWLLQPDWRFDSESQVSMQDSSESPGVRLGIPLAVGTESLHSRRPPTTSMGDALVTGLGIDGDTVTIVVQLGEAERKMWGPAAVRARPIHISNYGYPLVGVRVIASYLGQSSIIDGVVDVGSEIAGDIFGHLSREFRLQLIVNDNDDEVIIRREVAAAGLERNAALCIESARAALAADDYPPSAFLAALRTLESVPRETKMRTAAHSLAAGAYLHLMAPRETWLALADLNEVSKKENLDQLLQVDGLPVAEYETIRKRVLRASMDQGLCAPSRFWRRIIDSGLAKSHQQYVIELVKARSRIVASGEDDLDPDQIEKACTLIVEYCRRKNIPAPNIQDELQRASKKVKGSPLGDSNDESDDNSISGGAENHQTNNRSESQNKLPRPPSPMVTSISGEIGTSRDLDDEFAAYFDLEGTPTKVKPLEVAPAAKEKSILSPTGPPPLNSSTPNSSPPPLPPAAEMGISNRKPAQVPRKSKEFSVREKVPMPPKKADSTQSGEPTNSNGKVSDAKVAAPQILTPLSHSQSSEPSKISDRVRDALEMLDGANSGKKRDSALREVFSIWDKCDDEEILAIMPGLAKIGKVAVPRLIFKLVSPRVELRQAAAILLGMIADEAAIAPLCTRLMREQSQAWIEMARALAMYGERAVSDLSKVISQDTTLAPDDRLARACRVLAELAVVGFDSRAHASPEMIGVLQNLSKVQGASLPQNSSASLPSSASQSEGQQNGGVDLNLGIAATQALAMVEEVCASRIELNSDSKSNSAPSVSGFAQQAYARLSSQGHEPFAGQDTTLSCG